MQTHVAFGVDDANLDQVAVVIASVMASSARPDDFSFYVLFDGDAAAAERRVAALPWPVRIIPVVNPFQLHRDGWQPQASLTRLVLTEALPDVDRVIYLDADLVVIRDLHELYAADMGGNLIAGVSDLNLHLRLHRERSKGKHDLATYFRSIDLDPEHLIYINAGVLLMDLAAMRRESFVQHAIAGWTTDGARFKYIDQCLLNTVARGKVGLLDPRWNVMVTLMQEPGRHHYLPAELRAQADLQRNDPWLVHYASKWKPWKRMDPWRNDLWWAAAAKSGIAWSAPTTTRTPKELGALLWRRLSRPLARLVR